MNNKKLKKKMNYTLKVRMISTLLISLIVLAGMMFAFQLVGTTSIFNLIETIKPVGGRKLEFGIDEQGYNYIKNDTDEDLVVLQITDIHLSCSFISSDEDEKAVRAIVSLVNNANPDVIILTGDSIYPSFYRSLTVNNFNSSRAVAMLFESFQIPWAIVYGNHDTNIFSTESKSELSDFFSSLKYCMFQRGPKNITGQGNYFIKVVDQNYDLISALICMDSNSSVKLLKYDNIHNDQVEWYKSELANMKDKNGKVVKTHLFIHIPLNEYKDAWEKHKNNIGETIYHFGDKDWWRICCPDKRGEMFDAILEMNSTKTVFCGHDHTNTFSITYKGVRLTYGMSIDYIAYFGMKFKHNQRGGTILKIQKDGNFKVSQLPLSICIN